MAKFKAKLFEGDYYERNGMIIPAEIFKRAVDDYIANFKTTSTIIGEIRHINRDNNVLNIDIDEN